MKSHIGSSVLEGKTAKDELNSCGTHLRRWILKLGSTLRELSNKYPMVSGFYKMMAVVFNACSRFEYFSEIGVQQDMLIRIRSKQLDQR
eukprot:CAMPEP_0114535860 /NCGR_PEP_ID=MMETSP0109-20121206/28666_1 /TAXON_ID=29199 /ORGANISM="Chlorarachnion reptans, Strain CCCM449" /LENGTH=88 /DNA_ID=CAMNT_0001719503 /DNA_START=22 /DNA_END=284 /DNA_ORIENTATION=-